MRILFNLPEEKIKMLQRLSSSFGAEFYVLKKENTGVGTTVAAVVRVPSFEADLAAAVSFGIPVVVVAGTEDSESRVCIEAALAAGIPEQCILVKRDGKAVSLDGVDYGPAVLAGIGARPVVALARHALEKNLVPDVLVWEEPIDVPVLEEPAGEPLESAALQKVVPIARAREGAQVASMDFFSALGLADKIAVVFRAGSQGGAAVKELADALQGVVLELAPEPVCYRLFGATVDEALASRKYIYSDGSTVKVCEYTGAAWLVVDADLGVSYPEALSEVQKRAQKVYQIVGDNIEEGRLLVQEFTRNRWKLDGVLPERPELVRKLTQAFGKLLIPEPRLAVS